MGEDVHVRFTPTIEEVAKVEAEMKSKLANMVRSMMLSKIKVADEDFLGKFMHMGLILPAAISPKSNVASTLAEVGKEDWERRKAELMSIYRKVEAGLDGMSGKDLYDLIKCLRGRVALKNILQSLPPVQCQKYTVTKIEHTQYMVKNDHVPPQKSDNVP